MSLCGRASDDHVKLAEQSGPGPLYCFAGPPGCPRNSAGRGLVTGTTMPSLPTFRPMTLGNMRELGVRALARGDVRAVAS